MTVIKEAKDIPTNNALFEYLTRNDVDYTSHTYYNPVITVYKICSDSEEHLKNIDAILDVK